MEASADAFGYVVCLFGYVRIDIRYHMIVVELRDAYRAAFDGGCCCGNDNRDNTCGNRWEVEYWNLDVRSLQFDCRRSNSDGVCYFIWMAFGDWLRWINCLWLNTDLTWIVDANDASDS